KLCCRDWKLPRRRLEARWPSPLFERSPSLSVSPLCFCHCPSSSQPDLPTTVFLLVKLTQRHLRLPGISMRRSGEWGDHLTLQAAADK
ncbi:hypothetical protein S83_001082, partial [Arachis hypogaea]